MSLATSKVATVMRKIWKLLVAIKDRFIDWWWIDPLISVLLVAPLAFFVEPGTGLDYLGKVDLQARYNIYTDVLQLATIFAGFGAVSFTVFLSAGGYYVEKLKHGSEGPKLVRLWIASLAMPWICALVIIASKIVDSGDVGSSNLSRWFVMISVLIIFFQIVRVVRIFYQIATLDLEKVKPVRKKASRGIVIPNSE